MAVSLLLEAECHRLAKYMITRVKSVEPCVSVLKARSDETLFATDHTNVNAGKTSRVTQTCANAETRLKAPH